MGAVFEVVEPMLGRSVALKLLTTDPDNELACERFYREADVLAQVRHPGVVKIHRLGELPEGPYILEELVDGQSLESALERRGPYPPRDAAQLVRALADALASVHTGGIVHRDLKPANVMLREDGTPVLIDFGVARASDAETLTKTGALVGTVAYMAPEQVRRSPGAPPVDAKADVYALSLILCELITGERVHQGAPVQVMANILTGSAPALREAPPGLRAIARVALNKAPGQRPSAAELRDDLDRFLAGKTTESASRPGAVQPSGKGAVVALVIAAVGVLIALGVLLAQRPTGSTDPTPLAKERDPAAEAAERRAKELEDALARARELASRGEVAAATEHLGRAHAIDGARAQAELEALAKRWVSDWDGAADAELVERLDLLAGAWPDATLPPEAGLPYAVLASARIGEDDAGVVAAAELTARARRWDPQAPIPEGLGTAAAQVGKGAMATGNLERAARVIVATTGADLMDPSRVAKRDIRLLAEAEAFESVLARDRGSPFAQLWVAIGEGQRARDLDPGPRRDRRCAKALESLRAVRRRLGGGAAAAAACHELRVVAAATPEQVEPLASELLGEVGEEGWRVAHTAAFVLRSSPQRALPWARRAVAGVEAARAGSAEHADAVEALVRTLFACGEDAEAKALLDAEGTRDLLGPALHDELKR